jgi:hypothetical protein
LVKPAKGEDNAGLPAKGEDKCIDSLPRERRTDNWVLPLFDNLTGQYRQIRAPRCEVARRGGAAVQAYRRTSRGQRQRVDSKERACTPLKPRRSPVIHLFLSALTILAVPLAPREKGKHSFGTDWACGGRFSKSIRRRLVEPLIWGSLESSPSGRLSPSPQSLSNQTRSLSCSQVGLPSR